MATGKHRRWNTNKTPVDETLVDETLAYMGGFVLQGDQIYCRYNTSVGRVS